MFIAIATIMIITIYATMLAQIMWFYNQCDNDRDQTLSLNEFSQMLSLLRSPVSPEKAQQDFRMLDKDNSNTIKFQEFAKSP